jgi:hypothetical protein
MDRRVLSLTDQVARVRIPLETERMANLVYLLSRFLDGFRENLPELVFKATAVAFRPLFESGYGFIGKLSNEHLGHAEG